MAIITNIEDIRQSSRDAYRRVFVYIDKDVRLVCASCIRLRPQRSNRPCLVASQRHPGPRLAARAVLQHEGVSGTGGVSKPPLARLVEELVDKDYNVGPTFLGFC